MHEASQAEQAVPLRKFDTEQVKQVEGDPGKQVRQFELQQVEPRITYPLAHCEQLVADPEQAVQETSH